jgi:DNA-binding FadR family transcriptional regulator
VILRNLRRLHESKSDSHHDRVAGSLAKEILTGVYAPGENLPQETVLIERFKVSRTVLREALKTLSAKGLVVSKSRVGTRVLSSLNWNFFDGELLSWRVELGIDDELHSSLVEIRLAVEPASAALAATRRTEDQIRQLRECVRRMAWSEGNREKFAEADLEFHILIGIASGNLLMRTLAAVIEAALFASFQENSPVVGDDLEETATAHRAIVDAIEAGDADGARAAMVGVIELGLARISRKAKRPRQPRRRRVK